MSAVSPQPQVEAGQRTARPAGRRSKRPRYEVETTKYLAAAVRFIRAAGRRVADGDEVELAGLLALGDDLSAAIQHAVDGQRAMGKTWPAIAAATGKSPQAAQKRWGRDTTTDQA